MTVREICLQIMSLSLPPFLPFIFPSFCLPSLPSSFPSFLPSLLPPSLLSYLISFFPREIHLEGRLRRGKHFAFSLVIVQKQKPKFPFIHLFAITLYLHNHFSLFRLLSFIQVMLLGIIFFWDHFIKNGYLSNNSLLPKRF